MPGLRLPARLHETLRLILGILSAGHAIAEVRLPLYGALLCYLHICRSPGSPSMPEPVLSAVLEGPSLNSNPQSPNTMSISWPMLAKGPPLSPNI